MKSNTLAFVIVALIAGFIGGFWLANSINRSAVSSITPQPMASPAAGASQPQRADDITDAELQAKIAEADRNPGNAKFQKELGVALYRYTAVKQDARMLPEAARILERAQSAMPDDPDVLVALGNAYFDIGFARKDNASYEKARSTYQKALDLHPADADVQTDLGLTYFLQDPPAYDQAAAALEKVIASQPRHTRSMQFLVQVYAKQGKKADAERILERIKSADPQNDAIGELTSLVNGSPVR